MKVHKNIYEKYASKTFLPFCTIDTNDFFGNTQTNLRTLGILMWAALIQIQTSELLDMLEILEEAVFWIYTMSFTTRYKHLPCHISV